MFDLIWGAYFKDKAAPLWQYADDGNDGHTEVPFSEVLKRQEDLTEFVLVNRKLLVWYRVNLQNGTISVTEEPINLAADFLQPRADMLRKDDIKYRLIYFREVTRTFGSNLQETADATIKYFIGFQYTDSEGHNHKRIMCITADGRLVIN